MSANERPRVYQVGADVTFLEDGTTREAEVIGQSIAGVTKIRLSDGTKMLVATRILRPKS